MSASLKNVETPHLCSMTETPYIGQGMPLTGYVRVDERRGLVACMQTLPRPLTCP
jgi:hypothetical protein